MAVPVVLHQVPKSRFERLLRSGVVAGEQRPVSLAQILCIRDARELGRGRVAELPRPGQCLTGIRRDQSLAQ
jgi:hypothetical protein